MSLLLDEARLTQMKTTVSSLHVHTKKVFKRITFLDNVLVLEVSAKLIDESVICGCHCKVINMNAKDDLPPVRESLVE